MGTSELNCCVRISIHALREEGDFAVWLLSVISSIFLSTPSARRATFPGFRISVMDAVFLSTPSARRATQEQRGYSFCRSISIHALREEGDATRFHRPGNIREFLSTPSARRATPARTANITVKQFLSTPSARRATRQEVILCRTERFLSTPSARRATGLSGCVLQVDLISIHALREEGDRLGLLGR